MKKNEFIKLIRETVSKEVRRSLKTELRSILSPPDNSVSTFNEDIQRGVQMQQTARRTPENQQKYSNNEMLNGILNETANDMKAYPTAGRPMTSTDAIGGRASLAAAMGLETPTASGQLSAQEMIPADRRGAAIPESVSKALTKDYSNLMKAIDKKKNR